jgi:hypothetical protein
LVGNERFKNSVSQRKRTTHPGAICSPFASINSGSILYMQRSRSDFPASAGFGKSLNVEAPDFHLPPTMQNIAAFVQRIFSSPEAMHAAAASHPSAALTPASSADAHKTRAAAARATQPVTSYETVFTTGGGDMIRDSESTTFSIGGAAEASVMSRQTPNVGRGGKGPGSIGSGGALSRGAPRASCGDGLEASVAQLDLQSPQQPQKPSNPVQQAIRQAIQSTQQPTKQQQKHQSFAPQQHQEQKQQFLAPQQQQQQQRSLQVPPSPQPAVKQQKQKQSETRAAEDAAAARAAAVVKGPSCVVDEVLSSELEVCRFGLACVCLARGHAGRAQGLRCKYGLHTKQEWKDAQAKVELAEAAVKAANADLRKIVKSPAKAAGDAHRAIDSKAVSEGASSATLDAESLNLKLQHLVKQQKQKQSETRAAEDAAAPHAAAVVKGPSCVVDEVLSSELEVCRFGLACVCLARGHAGRAQGLRCKYGLHTKQEWKDAQAKVELAEAAVKAANADLRKIVKSPAKAAGDAHRAIDSKAVSEGANSAESSNLKPQQQDHQQLQQSKNGKDASVSAAGNKPRVGAEVAEQSAGPAAPALAKHATESLKQQDRQRDETFYPDLQRRLASERGAPASSEAPWLRYLTRPLSPFREANAMMQRNKELAVR